MEEWAGLPIWDGRHGSGPVGAAPGGVEKGEREKATGQIRVANGSDQPKPQLGDYMGTSYVYS